MAYKKILIIPVSVITILAVFSFAKAMPSFTNGINVNYGSGSYSAPNFGSANLGAINITNPTSNTRNAITFSSAGAVNSQAGIYVHQDNSAGTHMYFATTDSYATGPQARITILNNGNVGIGNTSPTSKLDVSGTITATTFSGGMSGTLNASNLSAGTFGANTGGGTYYFGGGTTNGASHYQFGGATYRDPGTYAPLLNIRQDNATTGITGFKPALTLYNGNGGLDTTVGLDFVSAEGATSAGNSVTLAGIMAIKESTGNVGGWSQGGLLLYTKNFGSRVDALRILNNGNVGVGTNSPGAKLDVNGDTGISGNLTLNGSQVFSIVHAAPWDHLRIYQDGASAYLDAGGSENGLAFRVDSSASGYPAPSYPEIMRLLPGGNVGIGTSNPLDKLYIAGSNQGGVNVLNSDGNDRPGVTVKGDYPEMNIISTRYDNINHGATLRFVGYKDGNMNTWNHWVIGAGGSAQNLDFGFSSSSQTNPHMGIANYDRAWGGSSGDTFMRITSSGYVGIGTVSPAVRLDVKGGRNTYGTNIYGSWTPDGSSLVRNWALNDGSDNFSGDYTHVSDSPLGGKVLRYSSPNNWRNSQWIPVDITKTYKISAWGRTISGTPYNYLSLTQVRHDLSDFGNGGWGHPYFVSYHYFPTTWTQFSMTIGPSGSGAQYTWNPETRYVQLGALMIYGGSGVVELTGYRIEEVPSTFQAGGSVLGTLNVAGTVNWATGNSSHLGTGANVTSYVGNSSVTNALIYSNDNNNDAWVMNWGDSAAWGIYNRNIDSDLVVSGALTVPSNSTAFIGGGLARAYISHQTGNAGFMGTVSAGAFSGPLSGTLNAANVSSGTFGANTGGGSYRFPGNIYTDANYGYGLVGVYTSTRYQGVFAMGDSYKLPADGTTPGNLYGLTWSHPNAGGVASNLNTHGLLVLENGTFLAAISGSIRARDNMQAPLFYDWNNTGYYVDPDGYSNTWMINRQRGYNSVEYDYNDTTYYVDPNSVSVFNDMRANIFYDRQDTGYYSDPNGTSNLNRITNRTKVSFGTTGIYNTPRWDYTADTGYWTGVMGWGTTDLNTIYSNWGSGFWDSWSSPANAPGGSSHYVGMQSIHYAHQNGSSAYGWQMAVAGEADNRFFWRSGWPSLRGWVEMIHSANIGSQSVNYAASAGSASSAGNADTLDGYHYNGLPYSPRWNDGWGPYDANTIGASKSGFTYAANAPWSGPLVRFDASGYDLELNAVYHGNGYGLSYRTRNGDAGSWNSWYRIYSDTYRPYADSAGNADTVDGYHGTSLVPKDAWWGSTYHGSDGNIYLGWRSQWLSDALNGKSDSGHGHTGYMDIAANRLYDHYTGGAMYAYNGRLYNGWLGDSVSVNYANSAGSVSNADTVDGWHRDDLRAWGNLTGIPAHISGMNQWVNTTSDVQFNNVAVSNTVSATTFRYDSDRNFKQNITTISNPIEKIMNLRGVTFNWKKDNKESVGLIAQEVEKVFPELVSGEEGSKSVQYGNLVAPLIEAVKAQQKEIERLEMRIKMLEDKE